MSVSRIARQVQAGQQAGGHSASYGASPCVFGFARGFRNMLYLAQSPSLEPASLGNVKKKTDCSLG